MYRHALCFAVAHVGQYSNDERKGAVSYKNHMEVAMPEKDWRLPSPPTIGKHVVSLCKFRHALIYTRTAKPFCFTVANVRHCRILRKPSGDRSG